jgi:uncharacterized phage-like protein YoqJ
MSICTFFGHRDCPHTIKPILRETLIDLIENHAVHTFYVGNHGSFDRIVHSVLKDLSAIYPQIRYTVVLAYLPQKKDPSFDASHTLFPEGIETTPKRFAISYRNKWMLRQSDLVVAYITHSQGGAAQFVQMAEKQKKTVINLAFKNTEA